MADGSICLSYALCAFSAMIYSVQVAPKAREVAFYLYSMAVKELHSELAQLETRDIRHNINEIVATALELAAMDVHRLNRSSNR